MCLWTVQAPSRLVPCEGPVVRESHGADGASGVNGCDGSSRVVQGSIGFIEIFKPSKVLV